MTTNRAPRSFEQTEQFVQLLAATQRRLYLLILALVHRADDAEEILGDTNLVLWTKFDEFQQGTDFWAWACQVARYEVFKFRDRQRFRGSWAPLSDEVLELVAETSVRATDELELRRTALEECLKKLRDHDRDLLDRRNLPGATVVTIAGELGRSVEGLYKVYQRIYRTLAECIDRAVARGGHS